MQIQVYHLEKYKYFYTDVSDGERVEDRLTLGFFSSKNELDSAIEICISSGISKEDLRIQTYTLNLRKHQKYVFLLSYGYSIENDSDGSYVEYYDIFSPQSDLKTCVQLKEKLLKEDRYQKRIDKIYDSEMPDGFWIEPYKLNRLYNVVSIS
jgi:hypothetical protein